MSILVTNEIKPLKKVLLHRPGDELINLTPRTLKHYLFDDIPYLKVAQREHDIFAEKFRENGVEVVYLEDLAAEVIKDRKIRDRFIRQFIQEAEALKYQDELYEYLNGIEDEKELILKTMSGVNIRDIRKKGISKMITTPMPNLYFTRDSFACVGRGVSLNKMLSVVRQRETIYGEYIFKYHKDYRNTEILYDRHSKHHIEGGDITNLSESVLAIGISERTERKGIDDLARNIFNSKKNQQITKILIFKIPDKRAFMHLDTVFTQVDYDKFVVHPEIIGPLEVYLVEKGKRTIKINKPLKDVLEEALGIENITMIKCGGDDIIASQREQWNDGSNTLCIAPGLCIVYERNEVTNRELERNGVRIITMPSSELSRGRGGPRCMSMPLERER